MKLWQRAKDFLFHCNIKRSSYPKMSVMTYRFLLLIETLQVTSILTMLPLVAKDRFSNTIYQFVGLIALPKFLQALAIPQNVALLGITPILMVYFLTNAFSILIRRRSDSQARWLVASMLRIAEIYPKLLFIPFVQLAFTGILHDESTAFLTACASGLCRNAAIVLGSFLLVLAIWFYYQFLFLKIPCYFDDGIESDNTQLFLDTIKGAQIVLMIGLASAGVNVYVIFALWGVFFALELIAFILIGYHSDPRVEKTCTALKGLQIMIFITFLVSNLTRMSSINSNTMLIALFFPLSTKVITNLKEIIKNRTKITVKYISQDLTENVREIDRYLKTLFLERKTKAASELELMSANFISGSFVATKAELATTEKNEEINKFQVSAYQDFLDHKMMECVANTYSSLLSRSERRKPNLSIAISWVLFLKDVKKNYIQAYIALTEIRKSVQTRGTFWIRLQFEMIETMIKLKIGSGALLTEKSVTANKLFQFLDDVQTVQRSIEEYLSKILQYYIMMNNPIVKATEAKSQGKQLLQARSNIEKKLAKMSQANRTHRHTIQLYTFFLKSIVEEKSRRKIFEINKNLLLNNFSKYHALDVDEKWDMSLEFFSNALTDNSDSYVAVLNLNSSNLGQIIRLSDNLMSLLDFSKPELTSLSITSLEATLFNRKNLNSLQELLLQGDNPFEKVPEKEKMLYLKNKSGRVHAFRYAAHLEIYDGNPCIVLYLRVEKNTDNNFVIFHLRKEGKIIGIGDGLSTILEDQWNKFSCVYDMIPEFPRDFNEESPPLFIQGVPLNFVNTKTMFMNSLQSFTSAGGVLVDYVARVHHISVIGKSYGIIALSSSFFTRQRTKSQFKFSEIRPSTIRSARKTRETKIFKPNSELSSGNEPFSTINLLFFPENKPTRPRKESVKFAASAQVTGRSDSNTGNLEDINLRISKENIPKFEIISPVEIVDEGNNTLRYVKVEERVQYPDDMAPGPVSAKRTSGHLTELSKGNTDPILPSSSCHPTHKENSDLKKRKILADNAETSSRTSTIGAHLTFLRSAISEKGDPTVIKTVYLSSAVIFITCIICTVFTYNLLVGEYTTFSGFAAHAAFAGILRVSSSSLFLSTQMRYAGELGLFAPAKFSSWLSSATTIATKRVADFMHTVSDSLVNFDPETLSSNLKFNSYSMLVQFPESSQFNRYVEFYEANHIFMGYAQKINLLKSTDTTIDDNLVSFMRTFNLKYQQTFLDPIRDTLFEEAYEKYDTILGVLDYILIGCLMLTLILSLSFFFVFRAFEKMETKAISKLCAVSKEELGLEMSKIAEEYQIKFNATLQMSSLLDLHFNAAKSKRNTGQRTTRVSRQIIGDYSPTYIVIFGLLVLALLLAGNFVVLNIVFKEKTHKILPFLTDIDKISAGASAYSIVYGTLFRLVNEVKSSQSNSSLTSLFNSYQASLDLAFTSHKNLMARFRNFEDRILESDITSAETKGRYRNLTDDSFCGNRDQNGTSPSAIALCKSSFKNQAAQGLPNTATVLITSNLDSIAQFGANPTIETVAAILQAPDSWDVNFLTSIITNAIEYLLMSEQVDVSSYAKSLVDVTTSMVIISLIYNVVSTLAIWVPIIIYLKRRFWIARNIFLLYPIRVLHSNEQIKQLFKKW